MRLAERFGDGDDVQINYHATTTIDQLSRWQRPSGTRPAGLRPLIASRGRADRRSRCIRGDYDHRCNAIHAHESYVSIIRLYDTTLDLLIILDTSLTPSGIQHSPPIVPVPIPIHVHIRTGPHISSTYARRPRLRSKLTPESELTLALILILTLALALTTILTLSIS
jgi:hypothetical protein